MKKNFYFLGIASLLLSLTGCGESPKVQKNANAIQVSVDTEMPVMTPEQMDAHFTNTRFLALKGVILGNITRIIDWDNLLVIFDKKEMQVALFDMNGNCVSQIKKPGRGPGEYIQISDCCVDLSTNQLVLYADQPGKFMRFDKQGKFISEVSMNGCFMNIISTGANLFYGYNCGDGVKMADYTISQIAFNNEQATLKEELPLIQPSPGISASDKMLFSYGSHKWLSRPFDNNIYALDSTTGEFTPRYNINLGSKFIPDGSVTVNLDMKKLLEDKYIFQITDIGETEKHLFFKCSMWTYMMDKQTNKVTKLGFISICNDKNMQTVGCSVIENQGKVGAIILEHYILTQWQSIEGQKNEEFQTMMAENEEWNNPMLYMFDIK